MIMKETTSSFLAVFCRLKITRNIYLPLNMLASISDLGYFCSSNFQFQN